MNLNLAAIKENKKIITIIIAALAAAVLAGSVLIFQLVKEKPAGDNGPAAPLDEATLIKQQQDELDALRRESGSEPPTAQEIKTQSDELDALRRQAGAGPSQADINKQLEELEKLRQSSQ